MHRHVGVVVFISLGIGLAGRGTAADPCCPPSSAPHDRAGLLSWLSGEAHDDDDDDQDGHWWCRRCQPAPRAPVVSSVPALMLAQPAVAVSPRLMTEAVRHRVQADRDTELLGLLREAIKSRTATCSSAAGEASSGSAANGSAASSAADNEALQATLDSVNAELESARKTIETLESAVKSLQGRLGDG